MLTRGVLLLLQISAVFVSFEPLAKSCLTTKSVDTDIFSPTLLTTTPTAQTTKFAGCTDAMLLFELLDGDTSISVKPTGPQPYGASVTAECTRGDVENPTDTVIEGIVNNKLARQDDDNVGETDSESITLTCENDGTWSTVLVDGESSIPGSFSEPNSLQCRDYYGAGRTALI